jgi:uncharacterized tellurite resistance protein B-like protein
MRFKGNFGELTLNINGTEATGTYQENGVLKGEFVNNTFKGQWENKGMEGLLEFTISGDKLLGNWKKGLELGTMKGKWEGKLQQNIQLDDNKFNDLNLDNKDVFEESEYHAIFPEVHLSNENRLACALAVLIRHFILVDGVIHEGEKNCMDEALDYFDKLSIPVSDVWDHVDDVMQNFELNNEHGRVISHSAMLLNFQLEEETKDYLIELLINIVCQDEFVSYEEFKGLSSCLKLLGFSRSIEWWKEYLNSNNVSLDGNAYLEGLLN